MTRVIYVFGFIVLGIGILAFLGGVAGGYMRAGVWGILERLNPFDIWNDFFLLLCIGPGLLLLGWASDRRHKQLEKELQKELEKSGRS